jgi:hypothetical protein
MKGNAAPERKNEGRECDAEKNVDIDELLDFHRRHLP